MEIPDLLKEKLSVSLEILLSAEDAKRLGELILDDNATLDDIYNMFSILKKENSKHRVLNINMHSLIDHLVVVGDKESQDQLVEKLTKRTRELLEDMNQEFYGC